MGDSEEGGGGSVFWKLDAKGVEPGKAHHKHIDKKVDQDGEDEDDKAQLGFHFTVSILKSDGFTQEEFLEHLKSSLTLSIKDNKRVYFNLPIEKKKAQIRVSWGASENHEGTGGTKPLDTRTTT